MVYSVNDITGWEAQYTDKHLAIYFAKKLNRRFAEIEFYIRVRMALAIVRANSLSSGAARTDRSPVARKFPTEPPYTTGGSIGNA